MYSTKDSKDVVDILNFMAAARPSYESWEAFKLSPIGILLTRARENAGLNEIDLHKRPQNEPELTYGEITDWAIHEIIRLFPLIPSEKFFDMGCGIASLLSTANILTACACLGVEIVPERVRQGKLFQTAVSVLALDSNIPFNEPDIREGDFLEFEVEFAESSLVICNNKRFEGQLNKNVKRMAVNMTTGHKILTVDPLFRFKRDRFKSSLFIFEIKANKIPFRFTTWGSSVPLYLHIQSPNILDRNSGTLIEDLEPKAKVYYLVMTASGLSTLYTGLVKERDQGRPIVLVETQIPGSHVSLFTWAPPSLLHLSEDNVLKEQGWLALNGVNLNISTDFEEDKNDDLNITFPILTKSGGNEVPNEPETNDTIPTQSALQNQNEADAMRTADKATPTSEVNETGLRKEKARTTTVDFDNGSVVWVVQRTRYPERRTVVARTKLSYKIRKIRSLPSLEKGCSRALSMLRELAPLNPWNCPNVNDD